MLVDPWTSGLLPVSHNRQLFALERIVVLGSSVESKVYFDLLIYWLHKTIDYLSIIKITILIFDGIL
jgi:hypothetical protein